MYQIKIKGVPGKFADKVKKIYNNEELAQKTLKEMFAEFTIAKDLIHPNIVEYKYFVKKFDPDNCSYEFHIVMELMDGEDMEKYIEN